MTLRRIILNIKYLSQIVSIAIIGMIFYILISYVLKDTPPDYNLPSTQASPSISLPHSFRQKKEEYLAVDEPYFYSGSSNGIPAMPDIKQELVYGGINRRPDADEKDPQLFIGIKQHNSWIATQPSKPIYLTIDSKTKPAKLIFSPNNEKTSFWLISSPLRDGIEITAYLTTKDAKGSENTQATRFIFSEKDIPKMSFNPSQSWEIGSMRVDSSLLMRLKTRWYGKDVFLTQLGDQEYDSLKNKERIEFGEGPSKIAFFLSKGDGLIYDEDHWESVPIGSLSVDKPLLVLRKQDSNILEFDLWNSDGRIKVPLQLHKSPVMRSPTDGFQFRFLGARSRRELNVEINRKKILIAPDDWILITDKDCQIISNVEEIDSYIEGRLHGKLLVCEGLEKIEDKAVLVATLYDETRTQSEELKLKLNPTQEPPSFTPPTVKTIAVPPPTLAPNPNMNKDKDVPKEKDIKTPLPSENESD